jgi:hypothetical protein
MKDESHIEVSRHATTFVGPDAINLFRATVLKAGLKMYADIGMIPNRSWTPTAMLKMATEYTGKTYKRGQHAIAAEDVRVWVETMKAAMPVVGP